MSTSLVYMDPNFSSSQHFQYMDPNLFNDAVEGNIEPFKKLKAQPVELQQIVTQILNDTILHINIKSQKEDMVSTEFVTQILEMCTSLLPQVNADGDAPLHVAAKCGHSSIVKLLIQCAKTEEEETVIESGQRLEWEMLKMTNYENYTALHEAVRHYHFDVVKILTKEGDPDFHYSANKLGETPLYLAAARGNGSMVIEILESCPSAAHEGPNGKTAWHAAAFMCRPDAVEKILEKKKSLTKVTDQHGWTPLHYAAYYYADVDNIELLLKSDRSTAYIGDKDRRMTPLHMAASQGHPPAIKTIISHCPGCYKLEDNRGWNVLHFAMLSLGLKELKDLLLESSLIRSLINKKDAKGNTPLHILAAAYRSVYEFGDTEAVNNQNVSVSDIIRKGYSELEKEIQALSKDVGPGKQYTNGVIRLRKETNEIKDKSEEEFKETRASHLVVATLIATVTFAAAFTFPGGYNSEKGPNQGTAILGRNPAFQAFIITDTIAMVLSLSAVFINLLLSFKEFQKSEVLFIPLFSIALTLTMFAMGVMVIAFITGTYAVLASSLGLAITTCFIGLIFFLLVFCILKLISIISNAG